MIYKVHEGCTVCWPDGSVRAAAGEVFDGFDDRGSRRSRDFASAILATHRDHIYPCSDAITATAVPPMFEQEFVAMSGSMAAVASEAPAQKKATKKATKKTTKKAAKEVGSDGES